MGCAVGLIVAKDDDLRNVLVGSRLGLVEGWILVICCIVDVTRSPKPNSKRQAASIFE